MSEKLVDKWVDPFTRVPNVFIRSSKDLSDEAVRLYVVLRMHVNNETEVAFPSYATLNDVYGMHPRKVARGLRELETGGWLVRERRPGTSNRYVLPVRAASKPAAKPAAKSAVAARNAPDERTKHPAIQALREIAYAFPDRSLYDQLIAVLGDAPDKAKLVACRQAWVARGYNKHAWTWALEWYAKGIPAHGPARPAAAPVSNRRPIPATRDAAARAEARAAAALVGGA